MLSSLVSMQIVLPWNAHNGLELQFLTFWDLYAYACIPKVEAFWMKLFNPLISSEFILAGVI